MKQEQSRKKSSPMGIFVGILVVLGFLASEATGQDTVVAILALMILAFPVVLFIFIVRAIVKRSNSSVHTHDRIDHSSDLKINPKTGKTTRPVLQHHAHSPQEHWKQQLDALLANGTIDRSEYRAMMNRKF